MTDLNYTVEELRVLMMPHAVNLVIANPNLLVNNPVEVLLTVLNNSMVNIVQTGVAVAPQAIPEAHAKPKRKAKAKDDTYGEQKFA